jgi:hypothetical protein
MAGKLGYPLGGSDPANPIPAASIWSWLSAEFSPGVVDQGQLGRAAGQVREPGGQFLDHQGELGDVGPVAGVGV